MAKDYLRMAFQNFTHRKLRTFLTLIGIFIGIAAVVGLVSLAQGFQNYLETEFKELGADKIMIQPLGSGFGPVTDPGVPLTKDDYDVVSRSNGVKDISYYKFSTAKIDWGKDDQIFAAISTYPSSGEGKDLLEELADLETEKGKLLSDKDRKKAVVGYNYAHSNQFDRKIDTGDKIKINDVEFEVIGVIHKIGNDFDDKQVFINEYDFDNLFDKGDNLDGIYVRVDEGRSPSEVLANIEHDLRKSRGVKEGEEDFEVQTFEELIQTFLTIFNIVGIVLVGIASISLVVGGIGIMNTMYTAVLERTKEIGIMKAIGARNEDVLRIFLIESGFLGLLGGAIGVILGLGFAKIVEYLGTNQFGTELLNAAMPWWLIVGALTFSFVLGSVSGLLPARQASKMNPVDALRSE